MVRRCSFIKCNCPSLPPFSLSLSLSLSRHSSAEEKCVEFHVKDKNKEASQLPIMADDGSGVNIGIPSVLTNIYDGNMIKLATDPQYFGAEGGGGDGPSGTGSIGSGIKGSGVVVGFSWRQQDPVSKVNWDFWTMSDDLDRASGDNGAAFKSEFAMHFPKFETEFIHFSPRYYMWDGVGKWRCQCKTQQDGKKWCPCRSQCSNAGR